MRIIFPYPQDFGLFPDLYEYITILQRKGIDANYIGWNLKDESRLSFIKSIASYIKSINPDIVHVFHFRGSGLLPLIAKDKRIKWIIDVRTVHVQNSRLQTDRFFGLKDRITWLETQVYDHIFVLTSYLKSKFQPSFRPMTIVPLGGSWDRLNPRNRDYIRTKIRRELGVPEDAIVLLYSGSLSPTRRVDVIIEAFARAYQLWSQNNVRLIIVGGVRGSPEISEKVINELMKFAEAKGVVDKIVFTGYLPYEEACQFYHAADVGISYLPSQSAYAYQPPTKIIEYIMAGLLVVSNRTPGVEEVVKDVNSAILCDDDADELALGIIKSLEIRQSGELFKQLVDEARAKIRWRDWPLIIEKYVVPVYERLAQ